MAKHRLFDAKRAGKWFPTMGWMKDGYGTPYLIYNGQMQFHVVDNRLGDLTAVKIHDYRLS